MNLSHYAAEYRLHLAAVLVEREALRYATRAHRARLAALESRVGSSRYLLMTQRETEYLRCAAVCRDLLAMLKGEPLPMKVAVFGKPGRIFAEDA